MNGDHPWHDWLNVLVIFAAGLIVVMMLVRLLVKWAQKDDGKRPNGSGPESGPDSHLK